MKRIAIIGCGGSGKTHLARRLGAALAIPVTHLDALHYDSDWNRIPANRFAALQRGLATQPRWVADGNYAATGVYDRITWDFVRYILRYRRSMRPRIRWLLAQDAGRTDLVVLRSRRATRRLLRKLLGAKHGLVPMDKTAGSA